MVRYTALRFLRALFAMWGVVTIVFILPRLAGDPVGVMAPLDTEQEAIDVVRSNLGLDRPIAIQYLDYFVDIARGDFGVSYLYQIPVSRKISEVFPATMQLALAALSLALFLGIPLGIISAIKRGGPIDHIGRTIAVLGQSVPSYFTAILLILFFTVRWQIFPLRGPAEGLASIEQLILPSVALGWFVTGPIARLTRSSMLEVLDSDYITMARMKGLKERSIVMKHAFRNALIPVLTYVSITFASLLGGVVIIEQIFAWPGLGRAALEAVFNWDFQLVQAVTIVGSAIFIGVNFLVDITYGVIDPRVRY